MSDTLPALRQIAVNLVQAAAPGLPEPSELMRSGRYSHLDGTGDYTEMAYCALMGLFAKRAAEDGLFRNPPRFKATADGLVLEAPRFRGRQAPGPTLPGVFVMKDAGQAWRALLAPYTVTGAVQGTG